MVDPPPPLTIVGKRDIWFVFALASLTVGVSASALGLLAITHGLLWGALALAIGALLTIGSRSSARKFCRPYRMTLDAAGLCLSTPDGEKRWAWNEYHGLLGRWNTVDPFLSLRVGPTRQRSRWIHIANWPRGLDKIVCDYARAHGHDVPARACAFGWMRSDLTGSPPAG